MTVHNFSGSSIPKWLYPGDGSKNKNKRKNWKEPLCVTMWNHKVLQIYYPKKILITLCLYIYIVNIIQDTNLYYP